MNKNLKAILDIFTEYVEHPSTRELHKWLVKSQVDTNDADYIYGMAIHNNQEIVAICIQIAWEASQSNSKDYDGNKEWLIERYYDNHEYYLRGLDEFTGTLDFIQIPEESRAFIREVLGSGYGSTAYDSDFENLPEDLYDNMGRVTEDGLKKHGYMFFDQLIREISQDMNRTQKNHDAHVEMVKTGIGGYGKVLDEDGIKYAKKSIGEELKAIEKCKSDIATLESFYSQFPKPEVA